MRRHGRPERPGTRPASTAPARPAPGNAMTSTTPVKWRAPIDAYVWLLTDPATAVGAAPFADVPCLPELPALIKAKYATAVNRWPDLQQRTSPTALLDEVVDGDLARSRVWREVMSRYGVRDV